ncbi:MAG: phosphate acyltransferase [Syntrophales bacterium]|nr:phosphate acyltransferase [Syntrophales bacterium]
MIKTFADLIISAKKKPLSCAVLANPGESDIPVLRNAISENIVSKVLLLGESRLISSVASSLPSDKVAYEVTGTKHEAVAQGIELVLNNNGYALIQGENNNGDFFETVLGKDTKLAQKGTILSYASVFSLLKREKLIIVTDTFINNEPTLVEKQQILQNALKLARLLGMEKPNVAILSSIEQVNPNIPSTIDAAILSKMGERRQFGSAIIEGPLDIDCALSKEAAARKGVDSPVTGNVDIYILPEIDTGYLLAEALVYFGRMQTAGVLLGSLKPVVLNVPFVSQENRVVELALAALIA